MIMKSIKLKNISIFSIFISIYVQAEKPINTQLSYAQGVHVAQLIEKQLNSQRQLGIAINTSEFIQGFEDQIFQKVSLTSEQITALNQELYQLLQVKNLEKNASLGLSNLDAGQAFMEKNNHSKTTHRLSSGLQYKVLKQGDGKLPTSNDTVVMHFNAKHIDGRIITTSSDKNHPLTIAIKDLIKGWAQGVKLMTVGSTYEFYIPSRLAYGLAGDVNLNIGPNEVLIYQVELINILATKAL